jgi:hypothetical protein
VVKGDVVNGEVIVVDAVGEVNDGGRAGTEGGVVEEGDAGVLVVLVLVLRAVGAGGEVLGAGTDVDAAAAAAMVLLRSHGFGGEPIVQIGRTLAVLRVQRNVRVSERVSVNARE